MSTIDPYGTDIAFDATGDLAVTASGALATVTGPYNCAQAITLRFATPLGELALHPAYGNGLATVIGAKMREAALASQVNADLQTLVRSDSRFSTAQIVNITTYGQPDTLGFAVSTTLSGGEQLTVGSSGDPAPQDVTISQPIDSSIDPTLTYDQASQSEFFTDDPNELDTLNDLNALASLINDQPGLSITGTGG